MSATDKAQKHKSQNKETNKEKTTRETYKNIITKQQWKTKKT